MPKRQRWKPVRGTGSRIYRPTERLTIAALDLLLGVVAAPGRLYRRWSAAPLDRATLREVLVLRLDRIGDVLMSLPALTDLRAALPDARIRLAVGAWSAPLARAAPVDEVLVWNASWAGRSTEGTESLTSLAGKARALRGERIDLALDLQGDVRAALLMRLTGARHRVGYANSGGGPLLTRVVPWDENVSWVEQNRRAVAAAVEQPSGHGQAMALNEEDRAFAQRLLQNLRLEGNRPLIGIHPSGGRRIKQWPVERWGSVVQRLEQEFGATVIVTGSAADRALARQITAQLSGRPLDFTGRLTLVETLALIASADLFLSPDTGPMHMACAVDTPSVAVFGPSDPVRYFSGGDGAPGSRHVVVRPDLWCSPCNLIRKPPEDCERPESPECLDQVTVEQVHEAAARLLLAGGWEQTSLTARPDPYVH